MGTGSGSTILIAFGLKIVGLKRSINSISDLEGSKLLQYFIHIE